MANPFRALLVTGVSIAFFSCQSATTQASTEPGLGPESRSLPAAVQGPVPGTRLVVLLVVDQLRGDLLARYDTVFTKGLRQVLDQGRLFSNATHDHAHTETSPGHATISTGTHPSRHGMISNQWWQTENGAALQVHNVIHRDYWEVGDSLGNGGAPIRLERTGLADWFLQNDRRSRVLSVSAKDRAAVLLAGKSTAPTFWFSRRQGRFVTSTYYADELPGWIKEFNEEYVAPALVSDSIWESTVPPEFAHLSRPDTALNERNGVHSWFPHRPEPESDERWAMGPAEWMEFIPHLDRLTIDLVKTGVEELDLGQDVTPDLLAISLSQIDRVGHAFGPLSREQLDNLIRLDEQIGRLLEFLDGEVGQGAYTMALTSDHGVLDLPEYRNEQGLFGRRLTMSDRRDMEALLTSVARQEVFSEPQELAPSLARAAPQVDWVVRAWPTQDLVRSGPSDSIGVLFRNSTFDGRATGALGRYGVTMQIAESTIDWGQEFGSTHGSPYYYDRHVPLIFMGPSVQSGLSDRRVATVDIAPTLAAWAGVAFPGDVDGRPINDEGLPVR